MTTQRRIKRRPKLPDNLGTVIREYLLNRSTRERSAFHENKLKAGLMEVLETVGTLDEESGHRTITLDEPISYVSYKGEHGVEKTVTGLRRQQRKGSMTLNEERTHEYLVKHKLFKQCTTTITVINEDAVLAANFEGTISDEDLKALYDEGDPTYAFILEDGS
jgi:hypothetical protein